MRQGGARRAQPAAALLLLGLALLAPLATAATASFTTEGAVQLPDAAVVRVTPQAFLVEDPRSLGALTLTAPRVHVYLAQHRAPEVGAGGEVSIAGPSDGGVREFELHDVVLTLSGRGVDGVVGIYPDPAATASLLVQSALTLAPHPALQMGGGVVDQGDDGAPGQAGYARTVAGPVLALVGGGEATYVGPGVLRVYGPTVTLAASENTTRYDTGRRVQGDLAVRQVNDSWMVLAFDEGQVRISHPRMQIAATEADLSFEGRATFADVDGRIETDDASYAANDEGATLDGTFEGTVAAARAPDGGAVAEVDLQGDLRATSLFPASSRAAAPVPLQPVGVGALVVLAAVAGVSGALVVARRRARSPAVEEDLTVDQFRDLADAAMENLRFADALGWLEKAQAHAPGSARLWMDKGYCLASLGDVEGALRSYGRAAELSSDGEADLLAASLLLRSGEPDLEAAERHVERALLRSPAMALEVQLDSSFDPLRGRPRFGRAVRRAMGDRGA